MPLLAPITSNEYTIRDSFLFIEELQSFDSTLIMTSFDVQLLFTNIPLQKTIDFCARNLFLDSTYTEGLSKNSFCELLTITVTDSLISADESYCKQHEGVAMGSPLGPTFANNFLCFYEVIWLRSCPSGIYRRFVDKTFLVFQCKNQIENIQTVFEFLT